MHTYLKKVAIPNEICLHSHTCMYMYMHTMDKSPSLHACTCFGQMALLSQTPQMDLSYMYMYLAGRVLSHGGFAMSCDSQRITVQLNLYSMHVRDMVQELLLVSRSKLEGEGKCLQYFQS